MSIRDRLGNPVAIERPVQRQLDSGVRVATTNREPRQPRPAPPSKNILPCDFRGPGPIGKLVCNCSGAAVVWTCSQPQIVEHNGMCIPLTPKKWMDGPLKRLDGTTSEERYIPLPQGGEMRKDGICLCENCAHRKVAEKYVAPIVWQPQPSWSSDLRFVRNDELTNATMELIPQLPNDVIGVIGIPVSGMIPASILSRMLCVPLYSFDHREGVVSVGDGRRSRSVSQKEGVYVVVDDTVYAGGEMKKARQALQKMDLKCIYAVVYTRDPRVVDIYSIHAPGSIILEWNIFNSGTLAGRTVMPECKGGICTDFDGVICEEPPVNDLRQPDEFQWWLANARPQYLPRKHEVPLIVSFRIEPWRAVTEAWMARWGVRTRKLVLHPSDSIQARNRTHNVAKHKGELFRDSSCGLMFESDERQARIIAEVSNKPVIVPTTGEIFRSKIKSNGVSHVTLTSDTPMVAGIKYPPITVRNLIYHVAPLVANDSWKRNLEQLCKRWHVFNGKKLIVVVDGPKLHQPAAVYECLPKDCEIVNMNNDPAYREQATFSYLLGRIKSVNPEEATFYAHSKGGATTANVVGATRWRNAMYHFLLDDMDKVEQALLRYAAVGTTRITKKTKKWIVPTGKTLPCSWIFAGTFFWFRHDAVFSRPEAMQIHEDRYAVEGWLGTFLDVTDGHTLYQPWPDRVGFEPNAYDPKYYDRCFND